jgi:putative holliday junction resolvase
MARVLGVDLGTARIGLAASDPTGITAQPLDVIANDGDPCAAVAERAREIGAEEIVVGLPVRLDGTKGPAAEAAEAFADQLRSATGLQVTLWDERLSTVEAARVMRAGGTNAKRQRGRIDKVAAALFLQSFLDSRR